MTNDLYNDIQSTIQDAYFSTAKIIDFISDARVYLYQLGTDQLEASFSNVRTQTHSRNCDFLELIDRLGIARQIDLVYENNESWKSQSRLETRANTKDYSSIRDWIGDLNVSSQDLGVCWNVGKKEAFKILTDFGYTSKDLEIPQFSNITMLCPFGSSLEIDENHLTIKPRETEFAPIPIQDGDLNTDVFENDSSSRFEDFLTRYNSRQSYDKYIEIEGRKIHKSNAINSFLNNKSKISSERLLRVQMDSNRNISIAEAYQNDSDFIKLTDTILTREKVNDARKSINTARKSINTARKKY